MKLNKGTILKASCDYIRVLQKDREQAMKTQQQQKSLESTAHKYADRVKELEEMLARQGVQVPPSHLPPIPKVIERPIKQEIDESPPNHTPTGSFVVSFLGYFLFKPGANVSVLIRLPIRGDKQHRRHADHIAERLAPEQLHEQLGAVGQLLLGRIG